MFYSINNVFIQKRAVSNFFVLIQLSYIMVKFRPVIILWSEPRQQLPQLLPLGLQLFLHP